MAFKVTEIFNIAHWMETAHRWGEKLVTHVAPKILEKMGLQNRSAHRAAALLGYAAGFSLLAFAGCLGLGAVGLALSLHLGNFLVSGIAGGLVAISIGGACWSIGTLDGARDTLLALSATPKTQSIDMTAPSLPSDNNAAAFNKEADKAPDNKAAAVAAKTLQP